MRRTLPAVVLAVALLSACGGVAPTPRPSPSPSPPPTLSPSPSPTAAPSEVAIIDDGDASPVTPPLDYDFSKFPRLPTPKLEAEHDAVAASAVAGCVTRIYEPRGDSFGRSALATPVCLTGPLPRTAPLVLAPGAPLSVRAPHGYTLGADVVDGTDVFAIVYASRAIPPRIDGVTAFGGVELTRAAGFNLAEIPFAAPTEPGDYLVAVAATLGRADRTYREIDAIFLYLLRVTAG